MPFGQARYGASVLGFTNANPCVLTVDRVSTQLTEGDSVIIAACVCATSPQINGKYLVTGISGTQVTIDLDATSYGTYVSGGFLTILELANPSPSDQLNLYQQFVPYRVYNLNQVPTFSG